MAINYRPVCGSDSWKDRLDLVERAAESQNAPANLGGTSWQLVRFQGSEDKILTPDDKSK
jgi:para-nitrobenzyl esterase